VTSKKPKLLFLCQNLPFPPDGGALIRSFHTLRLLSQEYEVTALCFVRRASRADGDAVSRGVEGLQAFANSVEAFPIPQEQSRARLILDHARSVLGRRAYTRWTYESKEFRHRIGSLLSTTRFDIIHLDSLDLVGYLPTMNDQNVVVAHHNVESKLLARRAGTETPLRGLYMRFQAALTENEERQWCPRVALNITVSDEDKRTLSTLAPGSRIAVAPNGVDTAAFQPSHQPCLQEIVFVGGHTWFPNRDGMEFFADSILPLLRRTHPDVRVTWVGIASEGVKDRMAEKGITMTGYVDDIRPYVANAKCFIVPLRVGGGTRLKILDAWALGKALVSTSAGCEGLIQHPGSNLLIADSPEAFAEAVRQVLDDETLRKRLERGGRETVEQHYDWSAIGTAMLEEYGSLAGRAESSGKANSPDVE